MDTSWISYSQVFYLFIWKFSDTLNFWSAGCLWINIIKTQRMSAGGLRAPEGPGGCAPHLRPSCSAATQLYLHLNREPPSGEIAGAVELDFLVFPLTQRSEGWGGWMRTVSCLFSLLFSLVIIRVSAQGVCYVMGQGLAVRVCQLYFAYVSVTTSEIKYWILYSRCYIWFESCFATVNKVSL